MSRRLLFLGVDGGGTRCRARLADLKGHIWGEGSAGPANIRLGLKKSFAAVLEASDQCLETAKLAKQDVDVIACLALAGASEPADLASALSYQLPFYRVIFTTDAHAACVGAHAGKDGGVIIIGTGSVGWAIVDGRTHRVGGWGFPISDEGSGAWIGCEVARRVLWACDGRRAWSELLRKVYDDFDGDPHAIVRWMGAADPGDFAKLAPIVIEFASRRDAPACELLRSAAGHIDELAERLHVLGVRRLALAGGLAPSLEPWLAPATSDLVVPAAGDPLSGALTLARQEELVAPVTQRASHTQWR